jgi:hypothetical protein
MAALREALERGMNRPELLEDDPDLDSLRGLPEFEKILLTRG